MFHGCRFDPDGAHAAADSTRSSTSIKTGRSVNPRTARRLVIASYTSMTASADNTHHIFDGPNAPDSLVRDDDLTIARVHHEDGKQLCRFSGAGIPADLMMIARLLDPALTGLIRTLGPIVHFAAYRPLKYARIDEG